MKVFVLNGSPKKESNTMLLTSAFLAGLQQEGTEIEIVSVIQKNIRYCTGCLSCWFREDARCVQQDDMNALLRTMADSDVILWSFPLYYHGLPAHMKALLDRTNPFLKVDMKITPAGEFVHEKSVDLSAKKHVVITGCGFPYYPKNFLPLEEQLKNILGEPAIIRVYESTLLTIPSPALAPRKQALLRQFTKAGKEFAETAQLSAQTLARLETPMLPAEAYIGLINSLKQ